MSTPPPSVHFTVHTDGSAGRSHYAVIGGELVETVDEDWGGAPDWDQGGICDPARGEAAFFYPAVALLAHLTGQAERHDVAELRAALARAEQATEGDSNDDEIDAYQEALRLALRRWPEAQQ